MIPNFELPSFELNIDFILTGLLIVAILLSYVRRRYRQTNSIKRFEEVLLCMLISIVLDIISTVMMSYPTVFPIATNYIITSLYYAFCARCSFAFVRYVGAYTNSETKRGMPLMISFGILIVYYGSLVLNVFYPIYFSYDANNIYHFGKLHILAFVVVAAFVVIALTIVVHHREKYTARNLMAIFLYSSLGLVGMIFQILFPTIEIALFATSIASLCVLFVFETPDYSKLEETMNELQQARQAAEDATEAKTSFLASMSHEIRTPVTAVLGLDEMILRESTEPQILEYAADIQEAGKTLLGIINDILDFSKVAAGKLDIIPEEYELSSFITDLQNMMSMKALDKGLYLVIKPDAETPYLLYGDNIRLKQVLINILANAIKYTDKGGVTVTIDFAKVDEAHVDLTFSVKDTGRGIRQADQERLFTPFERIDEAQNRNIEGTGLGISITQSLLNSMGSQLEVQSIFGVGSIFSFTIRQEVRDWTSIGENDSEPPHSFDLEEPRYHESFVAPSARVLVIDDTSVNLTVFAGLLKQTQVQIDTATSGEAGLEKAQQQTYHMIFIDHLMPGMDGIETMQQIREDDAALNIGTPMIALTANAVSGSREMYISKGFNDYLSKPIKPVDLETMLIQYLPQDIVMRK